MNEKEVEVGFFLSCPAPKSFTNVGNGYKVPFQAIVRMKIAKLTYGVTNTFPRLRNDVFSRNDLQTVYLLLPNPPQNPPLHC